MTSLVKEKDRILSKIQENCDEPAIDKIQNEEKSDEEIGHFELKNFLAVINDDKDYFSDPIVVEGIIYRVNIVPNGEDSGEGTHISVYI